MPSDDANATVVVKKTIIPSTENAAAITTEVEAYLARLDTAADKGERLHLLEQAAFACARGTIFWRNSFYGCMGTIYDERLWEAEMEFNPQTERQVPKYRSFRAYLAERFAEATGMSERTADTRVSQFILLKQLGMDVEQIATLIETRPTATGTLLAQCTSPDTGRFVGFDEDTRQRVLRELGLEDQAPETPDSRDDEDLARELAERLADPGTEEREAGQMTMRLRGSPWALSLFYNARDDQIVVRGTGKNNDGKLQTLTATYVREARGKLPARLRDFLMEKLKKFTDRGR